MSIARCMVFDCFIGIRILTISDVAAFDHRHTADANGGDFQAVTELRYCMDVFLFGGLNGGSERDVHLHIARCPENIGQCFDGDQQGEWLDRNTQAQDILARSRSQS
jgi:hypothetical protein